MTATTVARPTSTRTAFWARTRSSLTAAIALASTALLVACGGGSTSSSSTAKLRVLNASTGYTSLDLLVDDSRKLTSVAYGTQTDYIEVTGGSAISTVLTNPGSSTALSTTSRTLAKDVSYSLVAYGWQGAIKTAVLQDDVTAADAGKSKLMVMNLATDAGAVDIYLTGTDELLDDATAVASSVAGGATAGHFSVTAGTYRLRVTAAGDKTDLRLDVNGLALPSTQVASLVLTPTSGGVLVNGLFSVQKGALTAYAATKARARVVGAVAGNAKVSATVGGTTLATSLTSPGIGGYQQITGSSSAAVTVAVNGTALTVPTQAMPAGGDYTLLVTGAAAAPKLTLITDDNRLPVVTSNAKLRLLHAVNGLSSGLTLTADFSALATEVQPATASAYANVASSSAMRLEVSSALSATPLYTVTDAAITAKGLYTVFVMGDSSAPVTVLRRER